MRASLALTTTLYAVGLAVALVVQAYRPTRRHTVTIAALVVLECALILLAGADLVMVLAGDRPRDLAVHLAYVAVSVTVLPLMIAIGGAERKRPGMSEAIACAALVVIVARLQMTWGT